MAVVHPEEVGDEITVAMRPIADENMGPLQVNGASCATTSWWRRPRIANQLRPTVIAITRRPRAAGLWLSLAVIAASYGRQEAVVIPLREEIISALCLDLSN